MKQADIDRRLQLIGTSRPRSCPIDCPLHPCSKYHNPMVSGGHVPPKTPRGALLLVLGICPGEEEELGCEPFIGPSGRYASHALKWASGSKPIKFAKANLCNCRTVKPGKTKSFINRTPPTQNELMTCYHAIVKPLLERPWRCVALFGTDVYKFLVPEIEIATRKYVKLFDVFGKAMGHRCVFDVNDYPDWFGEDDDESEEIPF